MQDEATQKTADGVTADEPSLPGTARTLQKFSIMNSRTREVQVVAEIECTETASASVKLGLAVRWAVRNGASLVGADLAGAVLVFAKLAHVDLSSVNLAEASLTGANLSDADLVDADLRRANLSGANLSGARLAGADLSGANLVAATISGASLTGATLSGANLAGTELAGAELTGATWAEGVSVTRVPLLLTGLPYHVLIFDAYAQVGCQLLRLSEWEALTEEEAEALDGAAGRAFWRTWREPLLALARADGRSFESAPPQASDGGVAPGSPGLIRGHLSGPYSPELDQL
jgi:uncharacterized protein YjbI with pentapeptide repeats